MFDHPGFDRLGPDRSTLLAHLKISEDQFDDFIRIVGIKSLSK